MWWPRQTSEWAGPAIATEDRTQGHDGRASMVVTAYGG